MDGAFRRHQRRDEMRDKSIIVLRCECPPKHPAVLSVSNNLEQAAWFWFGGPCR